MFLKRFSRLSQDMHFSSTTLSHPNALNLRSKKSILTVALLYRLHFFFRQSFELNG